MDYNKGKAQSRRRQSKPRGARGYTPRPDLPVGLRGIARGRQRHGWRPHDVNEAAGGGHPHLFELSAVVDMAHSAVAEGGGVVGNHVTAGSKTDDGEQMSRCRIEEETLKLVR